MAIALDCQSNHPGVCAGRLARAALTGGAPRDVADGIQEADWAPDGKSLLVVRDVDGKSQLEYPMDKVLYRTSGHISYARLSPKGDRIAFMDHPFPLDDAGTVAVVDMNGNKKTLTGKWASEGGLAWSASGDEIWFTATEAGANRSLYGVTLTGRMRVVARVPGGLKLHDIARNGRVLLTRESPRVGILGMLQGDTRESDMSFLDYSFAADMGVDSHTLLFDEEGEAGGANYTVYLRKSDRSPVVRLGEGNALSLSPDGKWALSIMPVPNSPFRLLATGTGEPKLLRSAASTPNRRRHGSPTAGRSSLPEARPATDFASTGSASTAGAPTQSRPRESSWVSRDSRSPGTENPSPPSPPIAGRCSFPSMAAHPARSPASPTGSFLCAFRRTGARSSLGNGARSRPASSASTSNPDAARSGKSSFPSIRRASNESRTSSSARTEKGTPIVTRDCCPISSSSKG